MDLATRVTVGVSWRPFRYHGLMVYIGCFTGGSYMDTGALETTIKPYQAELKILPDCLHACLYM